MLPPCVGWNPNSRSDLVYRGQVNPANHPAPSLYGRADLGAHEKAPAIRGQEMPTARAARSHRPAPLTPAHRDARAVA